MKYLEAIFNAHIGLRTEDNITKRISNEMSSVP